MLRIEHERYTKSQRRTITTDDGQEVERKPDEEVDASYVERYLSAKGFFEGLGGTEEHYKRSGGVISVKATAPDGTEMVETIFTPVRSTRSNSA
jgi:hypothetical protein